MANIIDGIDVTKCEYYGNCDNRNCEGDCYYKQLKRIKEENEKLKSMINKPVFLPNIEEQATNKFRKALEEIMEYIGTCCHRFSENHKAPCLGCEYDKEVCDYSIILAKINEVIGAEECQK